MNMDENIRIGMEGILAHRIRSILTALGIIFGVAATVGLGAVILAWLDRRHASTPQGTADASSG